jgi:hypothetical protein
MKLSFSSRSLWRAHAVLALLGCMALGPSLVEAQALDPRGNQFIALKKFSSWTAARGERRGEVVLTSPEILSRIQWNELVLSWNANVPEGCYLVLEARAIYLSGPTKWYNMGRWSVGDGHPRESVLKQRDQHGDVETDTLILRNPTDRLQVRAILGRDGVEAPEITFIGLALTDSRVEQKVLPPNRKAWGRTLPVPERSQMAYPNGNVICSPTTVSMMLAYWADRLNRPDLNRDVPEVVKAVYDTNWRGTGNWAFNMAYAGSFDGMRAYVTRMSDVSDLEYWIAEGYPVGLSLCYDLLRGRPSRASGHLVVCVGFTPEGDPIINDPGTRQNVRKVFTRQNLIKAWAHSKNAAYLVYPEDAVVPRDRFGHWDSWTARQRISTRPAMFE